MLKKPLWKGRISILLALLASAQAGCKGAGAVEDAPAGKLTDQSAGIAGEFLSGAGGREAFRFDGKEYFISAGSIPSGRGKGLIISIPASSGLRLEGFIGGARESAVTVYGGGSAEGLMEKLGQELARQGYVKKSQVTGEGLAAATWELKGGAVSARIFAMEEEGLATAKLVARIGGK